MPDEFRDNINLILRDHEGYTGDGQGGVGELPIGDRSTARKPISKRDLREALFTYEEVVNEAEYYAEAAEDAAQDAIQNGPFSRFDSISEFEAADIPAPRMLVEVMGYYEHGDGGYQQLKRIPEPTPAEAWHLQSNDGAWWLNIGDSSTYRLEMFGGRAVPDDVVDITVVETDHDVTDAFNAASDAALEFKSSVEILPRRYAHSATLIWHEGVHYFGHGSGLNHRPARTIDSGSTPAAMFALPGASEFVAIGTFVKTFTVDFITANTQCGYDREIPQGERLDDNGIDDKFELLDFTNRDADEDTPATLRAFSVAHHFKGNSQKRFRISGVRFIVNCPDPDVVDGGFGTGGYAIQDEVVPFADVDVGVFCESPWRAHFNFDCVGYYNDVGFLATPSITGEQNKGYAEHNIFAGCLIQSGTAFRSGDTWPLTAKTADSVTVAWTSSHRFESSGTIRVGTSAFSYDLVAYTSLTYSAANGGELTFGGLADTSSFTVGGDDADHIIMTPGAGFALTVLRDCEFYDFAHSTLIDCTSNELGSRKVPYRACLEVSGNPMRALRFENCIIHPAGPIAMHFGKFWDGMFDETYCEPRNRKDAIADSDYGERGAVVVFGPKSSYSSVVGDAGKGSIYFEGRSFYPGINRAPLRPSSSSSDRLNSMTDLFNPVGYEDAYEFYGASHQSRNTTLWTAYGQEIDMRVRQDDGTLHRVLRAFPISGTVNLGDDGSGNALIQLPGPDSGTVTISAGRTFRPDTDDAYDLGTASYRWEDVRATNATIQTSDERQKEFDGIPEVWLDAWGSMGVLRYKWKSAVAAKGDKARWHIGINAQAILRAFAAHGIPEDVVLNEIAIIGYDEWDDEFAPVMKRVEVKDAEGNFSHFDEVETGETKLVKPAGSLYNIRPNECMWLEMAWSRRELSRLKHGLSSQP